MFPSVRPLCYHLSVRPSVHPFVRLFFDPFSRLSALKKCQKLPNLEVKKCCCILSFLWDNGPIFLDAFSPLGKRVCPSVRPSIRCCVRPSIRLSVIHELNFLRIQYFQLLWNKIALRTWNYATNGTIQRQVCQNASDVWTPSLVLSWPNLINYLPYRRPLIRKCCRILRP